MLSLFREPARRAKKHGLEKPRVQLGKDALATLQDPSFQAQWRTLYEQCPWASAETPDVLVPWYEIYTNYEPIIVIQRTTDGALAGLLPLARRGRKSLVHAGHDTVEYISWLCEPSRGNAFIVEALEAVREAFGPVGIKMTWLMPNTPVDWLDQRGPGLRCELLPQVCYVVPLTDKEALEKHIRSKKRLRTKMNKLRRQGELCYRQYTSPDELEFLLDRFLPEFYVRKAAAYGLETPSPEEQQRRRALLLRYGQTPGLLQAVGFELDGQPVAMHVTLALRGEVSQGGLAHAPEWAKLSPAQLLLLEQMRALHEAGFELFDFSPGEDSHKVRLGAEPRTIYGLYVHPRRAACLASKANKRARAVAKAKLPPRVLEVVRQLRSRGN